MSDRVAPALSVHQLMDLHPSTAGWQRVEARSCGGQHPTTPGAGPMVLWRRRRDMFDRVTYEDLDPADDPPMWLAEHVTSALCVTDRWAWMQREVLGTSEIIGRDMGQPWEISPGPIGPGSTVTLTTENGRWVWELTGDKARCCGGYLARWPD